mmetsp:Transcript_11567/g.13289  ORF Transcript_11567/g.13289 Transcript_11567/m.13289 type:complete len:118 (+) Transcript_11567:1034-1387(+)
MLEEGFAHPMGEEGAAKWKNVKQNQQALKVCVPHMVEVEDVERRAVINWIAAEASVYAMVADDDARFLIVTKELEEAADCVYHTMEVRNAKLLNVKPLQGGLKAFAFLMEADTNRKS